MTTQRVALSVLLAVQLAGCATWRPVPDDPARTIREHRPRKVRVWRSDGDRMVIELPVVANDSIAVVSGDCVRSAGRSAPYRCPTRGLVALRDVDMLEVGDEDTRPMTIIAIGELVILALGFVYCGGTGGFC